MYEFQIQYYYSVLALFNNVTYVVYITNYLEDKRIFSLFASLKISGQFL
jgi:hypothetical protein